MDWLRSGISSISGMLGDHGVSASDDGERVAAIRESMMEVLGANGAARNSRLAMRIRHCLNARRLWDLRTDLMNAASVMYGEANTRESMKRVDAHFAGMKH